MTFSLVLIGVIPFFLFTICHVIIIQTMLKPSFTEEKLPFNWVPLVVVFNMLGKTGTSAVYMTMYLYTPEIYPTEIRGLVFGVCDLISYAACTISPYARVLVSFIISMPRGLESYVHMQFVWRYFFEFDYFTLCMYKYSFGF